MNTWVIHRTIRNRLNKRRLLNKEIKKKYVGIYIL